MRFAYADPPYMGTAGKYDHPETLIWNNIETWERFIPALSDWFPDGWAMSMTSRNLRDLLPLCPPDVRVLAWVKPFAAWKPGVYPPYAWEPILLRGGRKERDKSQQTVRDWVSANMPMGKGLVGSKPSVVCWWLLEVLGYRAGEDELIDLFPGTGIMDVVSGVTPLQAGLFAAAEVDT